MVCASPQFEGQGGELNDGAISADTIMCLPKVDGCTAVGPGTDCYVASRSLLAEKGLHVQLHGSNTDDWGAAVCLGLALEDPHMALDHGSFWLRLVPDAGGSSAAASDRGWSLVQVKVKSATGYFSEPVAIIVAPDGRDELAEQLHELLAGLRMT